MIDLIGQKFGRLRIIQKTDSDEDGRTRWLCQCSCGHILVVRCNSLQTGNTKSCGYLRQETAKCVGFNNIQHGHAKHGKESKIYRTWKSILTRCTNPNDKQYKDYGGRGITVCKRWLKFPNFLEDIGKPPTPKHTFDRINNNKGYSEKNCRWATREQQSRNKRNNRLETYNGKTQCVSAWADEYGVRYTTLWARLYIYNWSMKKALTEST